jgi:hypothetical protein
MFNPKLALCEKLEYSAGGRTTTERTPRQDQDTAKHFKNIYLKLFAFSLSPSQNIN